MDVSTRLITLEDFEHFLSLPENQERHFELIDGEIVEKAMPTEEHGVIIGRIIGEFYIILKQVPGGRIGPEIRTRAPGDDLNSRQPDIAYFADASCPLVKKGAVPHLPDLVVEVKSPTDTYKAMQEHAAYYLEHGTQIVWLVYPEKRLIEVHDADGLDYKVIGDFLDGGHLLPQLRIAVSDLFAD